jgi:Zn finger protein HypA/HybF involved in hydrogenase expression
MRTWTKEQLYNALLESRSWTDVLRLLGLQEAGGNYSTLRHYTQKYGFSTNHFTSQGWSRGKNLGPKKPLSFYLTEDSNVKSDNIRKRLIKEGYKEHKCEQCGIIEWCGLPTPLELHHINGKKRDFRLDNLRVVCNNCHAQTNNYRGKNKTCRGVVEQQTRGS